MPKPPRPPRNIDDSIADALDRIEDLKLNGQHEESIKEAQKLLFNDPDCVAALEEVADNYVSLDEYEKAIRACHRALSLDSKSFIAHYILGFIDSQHQDWEVAIQHLKISNDLHPNNPEILRCLGWALFNGDKRTQGLVILERALNLDTENSLTLCDLGICHLQVKNFDKAMDLLKKAIEIDPDNKRIQDCLNAAQHFHERFANMKKESRPRRAK